MRKKGTVIATGWSGKVKTFTTTLYSGVEYFVQNWKCLGLSK